MKTKEYVSRFFLKQHQFRRLTSFSVEEFTLLSEKLERAWKTNEQKRLESRTDRKRKVGQGRPYVLGDFRNLLFVTILYLRTHASIELLALIFRVDDDTVRRSVMRVLPLVQDRFIPITALTKGKKRINDLDELLRAYPELEDVIFDGTEFPIQRPKKRQRQSYSGKKKHHTKKSQLALDRKTKLVIGLSPPRKGKIHDKKHLERIDWDRRLPQKVKRRGDLGYIGMPKGTWIIPHKKPKGKELTQQQKRENKKLAKERIYVEHGIRRTKVFRRVGETINVSDHLFSLSLLAATNLANFKWLVRQGLG